jgi:pyridinium-3,5-biscarboxylic acid mononucleotide synthase
MDQAALRTFLEKVRDFQVSPDQAIHRLRHLPFEDLGFAKIDHHRHLRPWASIINSSTHG